MNDATDISDERFSCGCGCSEEIEVLALPNGFNQLLNPAVIILISKRPNGVARDVILRNGDARRLRDFLNRVLGDTGQGGS